MRRVLLAHDYLTQYGGAERVALSLTRAFPGSPMLTSFYEPQATFEEFTSVDVITSRFNRIAAFRADPRRALPLLPRLWDGLEGPQADVVLCSSSGWAHGLQTSARKVVYCHNPARWLYQPSDYEVGTSRLALLGLRMMDARLRRWDARAARSADLYLANSETVAARIRRAYGIDAEVVHPPVLIDVEAPQEAVPGVPPEFFLVVGRSRGYKNVEAVVEAFVAMPDLNLVVVGGSPEDCDAPNVVMLPHVSEGGLRRLYAEATALVATAFEDFGLTVVEAAAFGTPAVALSAGGYLETVVEGVSGRFVTRPEAREIMRGVRAELAEPTDRETTRQEAKRFSEAEFHTKIRRAVDGA